MSKTKIIFVCTGNASRSALSEVILREKLRYAGIEDIEVASCGTNVPDGLEREPIMCRIAAEHGYYLGGKAIQMRAELLNSADIIIVMTESHRGDVKKFLREDFSGNVLLFNEYCFGVHSELPDPHYQGEKVYRECFDTIEKGCGQIVKKFKDETDKTTV